jgi:hypothetical protein
VFDWDLGLTGAARAETPKASERDTIISRERIEGLKKSVYSNVERKECPFNLDPCHGLL